YLFFEEVNLRDVVDKFSTPVYVYSKNQIKENFSNYKNALKDTVDKIKKAFVESMVLSDAVRVYTNIFINDEHEFKSKDNEKRNSLSTKVIFSDTLTNVLLGKEGEEWHIKNRQFRMITASEPITNILNKVNSVYAEFLKKVGNYEEIEAFNGHGYIPLELYRALAIQSKEWNPKKEAIYKKIVSGQKIDISDIVDMMKGITIFKIHYGGPLLNSSISEKSQDKFALLPIHPNMFKNLFIGDGSEQSNIFIALYSFMKKYGIHYVNSESGSKQALISNSKKEFNEMLIDKNNIYYFNSELEEMLKSNISIKDIFYLGLNTYNGKEQKTKIMLNVKYPIFLEIGKLVIIERVLNEIEAGQSIDNLKKIDVFSDIYDSVKIESPEKSDKEILEIVKNTLKKNKDDLEIFILNMDEFRKLGFDVVKKLTNIDVEGFSESDMDKLMNKLFSKAFGDISDEHKDFVKILKNDIKVLGLNESMIPLIRQKMLSILKKMIREPKYMTGNMPIQSVYIPDIYDIGDYNIKIERTKNLSPLLDFKFYNRSHYAGRIILPLSKKDSRPKEVTIDGKIYEVTNKKQISKAQIKAKAKKLGIDEKIYIKSLSINYNFYVNVDDDFLFDVIEFKGDARYNTFTTDDYMFFEQHKSIDEFIDGLYQLVYEKHKDKNVVKVGVYDSNTDSNKLIIVDKESGIILSEIKELDKIKELSTRFKGYSVKIGTFYNQTGLGYSITKEYSDVLSILPGSLLLFSENISTPILSDGTIIHSVRNDKKLNGFLYLLKYAILHKRRINKDLLKDGKIDVGYIRQLIKYLKTDDYFPLAISSDLNKNIRINSLIIDDSTNIHDEQEQELIEEADKLNLPINENIEPDSYTIAYVNISEGTSEDKKENIKNIAEKIISKEGSIVVKNNSAAFYYLKEYFGEPIISSEGEFAFFGTNPFNIYDRVNIESGESIKMMEKDLQELITKLYDRYVEAITKINEKFSKN
ncbi:MAG: hypothetical protein QXF12_07635, partial [Candidatus Aenigmatarchaeota archaeon]